MKKKVQKVTLEAYIFRERGNKSIDMHKIYMVTPICCDILFSILYSKKVAFGRIYKESIEEQLWY